MQACARSWTSPQQPNILLGRQVERASLETMLASQPSVLHLATHVVQPLGQKEQAMLAIGLDASGQPDFLTPTEIGSHLYRPGLVVMTGCSSGQGSAQPGAGLLGLTRSWILTGAQSVVASHWPTLDNTGVLFQEFYSAYPFNETEISSAAVAAALQHAQVKMLHSVGWRAQPRHWAAFYVMGKD